MSFSAKRDLIFFAEKDTLLQGKTEETGHISTIKKIAHKYSIKKDVTR